MEVVMRVFNLMVVFLICFGLSSAFAFESCLINNQGDCVREEVLQSVDNGVVLLGVAGGAPAYLSPMISQFENNGTHQVSVIQPKNNNAVVSNRVVGKPFDVLVSFNEGEIRDELMVNGFADWVFKVEARNNKSGCGYVEYTIPYQNKNREAAVLFIASVLEQKKTNCGCEIVFEGNIEKLDYPLAKYIQAIAIR